MNKLLIFDMDGVIVDTEHIYRKLNSKLYDELGIEISLERQYSFAGIVSRKKWTHLKEEFGLKQSVEELIEMAVKVKYDYLSRSDVPIEPIEGIEDLLKELKKNKFIVCLASSSPRKNIDIILNKAKVINYFDYVVSGDEVKNGKPSPDIFLNAAEKFNASVSDCTVVEDSGNGVTAAKAADMKCVGFRNPNSGPQKIEMADIIIDKFDKEGIAKIIELGLK